MTRITALAAAALIATSSFAMAGGAEDIRRESKPVVVVKKGSSTSAPGALGNSGPVIAVVGALLIGAALSNSGSH